MWTKTLNSQLQRSCCRWYPFFYFDITLNQVLLELVVSSGAIEGITLQVIAYIVSLLLLLLLAKKNNLLDDVSTAKVNKMMYKTYPYREKAKVMEWAPMACLVEDPFCLMKVNDGSNWSETLMIRFDKCNQGFQQTRQASPTQVKNKTTNTAKA